ncbi:MAG: Uma2 family endonuclease, partial [Rhodanobacteraceae bacterium]
MSLAKRDEKHHTYADYLRWPEDVRYELIDGVAYAMAGPDLAHQEIVGDVYRQLANALEGQPCRAFVAPFDVRLPRPGQDDAETDTVVQPDVMVVRDPAKLDRRGVRGAPDLVVEVLSPSTAGHDQVLKRRVYERAGVREFWLVHPGDRIVTIYRLQGGAYGKPDIQELSGTTAVRVLPGVAIAWDALAAR